MAIEVYRSANGAEIGVIAATWDLRPTVTFESLAMEFARDEDKAWKNYGSRIKTGSDTPLDPELADRQANRARVHPWDADRRCFASWFRGEPGQEYFIHLDLAKNHDRAGVAVVHRDRVSERVVVDFMDGVVGRAGRDVQIADLRDAYVYDLTTRGFSIKGVSLDQWNSLDTIQQLTNRGYLAGECSADKTMEPYDTLFGLIREGRLDYYLHPTFMREIKDIRRFPDRHKYDHRRGGSKDVSDAVACAAFKAIEDSILHPYTGVGMITVHRSATMRDQNPGWD